MEWRVSIERRERSSEALVITRSEFEQDRDRYVGISIREQQVRVVSDETGQVLIILGTGPSSPEERESARIALAEMDREIAEMYLEDYEEPDTSWFD